MDSNKVNFLHAGLGAFGDLKHEIDAVVRQFNDLRHHAHVEVAGMVIDLD